MKKSFRKIRPLITTKEPANVDSSEILLLELDKLKEVYSYPINSDFKIRELTRNDGKRVFICYLASIINANILTKDIIPNLLKSEDVYLPRVITNLNIKKVSAINEAVISINNGFALVIYETENQAYIVDVAKFEARNIEKSGNEIVIKGPKEAFTETIQKNLSMVRKIIRSEHLIVEEIPINKNKTEKVSLVYLKHLANESILQNIRDRLTSIDLEYIQSIEMIEQLMEERPYSLFSSILYTEKPDRVAYSLNEGHIALFTENSSASLIMPATFWSLFHSGEDHYLRFIYGNFARLIRVLGLFITLFTSALYVAVTNFHQEMIPTDLLLAIASAREKVPFPVVGEVFIMEISFELIREAGLRIPTPLGPTIGIVGALILGQAAVQANLISPIIVIVVALSGLSSFTISDISLNYSVRILRFAVILSAGLLGIYGVIIFFVCFVMYLSSLKSFGVSFLSPATPNYKSSRDTIFRTALRKEKYRPGFLLPKKLKKRS